MSTELPEPALIDGPSLGDARVAMVSARFNGSIVEELAAGCARRLAAMGLDASRIERFATPGAFELPLAAKLAGQTRRFAAVICLGCVIRGDTPHFEYVAGECARGIAAVSLELTLPVIFGVLTTNTRAQALERLDGAGPHGHAGERAADAAAEMIALARRLH